MKYQEAVKEAYRQATEHPFIWGYKSMRFIAYPNSKGVIVIQVFKDQKLYCAIHNLLPTFTGGKSSLTAKEEERFKNALLLIETALEGYSEDETKDLEDSNYLAMQGMFEEIQSAFNQLMGIEEVDESEVLFEMLETFNEFVELFFEHYDSTISSFKAIKEPTPFEMFKTEDEEDETVAIYELQQSQFESFVANSKSNLLKGIYEHFKSIYFFNNDSLYVCVSRVKYQDGESEYNVLDFNLDLEKVEANLAILEEEPDEVDFAISEFFGAMAEHYTWSEELHEQMPECTRPIEVRGSDMDRDFAFIRIYEISRQLCQSFIKDEPFYETFWEDVEPIFCDQSSIFIATKEAIDRFGRLETSLVATAESLSEIQPIAEHVASLGM